MAKLNVEVKSEINLVEINALINLSVNGRTTVIAKWMCNLTIEDFEEAMIFLKQRKNIK